MCRQTVIGKWPKRGINISGQYALVSDKHRERSQQCLIPRNRGVVKAISTVRTAAKPDADDGRVVKMDSRSQLICPDVLVRDEGTLWVFNPLTSAAQEWFAENVQSEPWQWLGTSLVVEHRFAIVLIQGIEHAGFAIG